MEEVEAMMADILVETRTGIGGTAIERGIQTGMKKIQTEGETEIAPPRVTVLAGESISRKYYDRKDGAALIGFDIYEIYTGS